MRGDGAKGERDCVGHADDGRIARPYSRQLALPWRGRTAAAGEIQLDSVLLIERCASCGFVQRLATHDNRHRLAQLGARGRESLLQRSRSQKQQTRTTRCCDGTIAVVSRCSGGWLACLFGEQPYQPHRVSWCSDVVSQLCLVVDTTMDSFETSESRPESPSQRSG